MPKTGNGKNELLQKQKGAPKLDQKTMTQRIIGHRGSSRNAALHFSSGKEGDGL